MALVASRHRARLVLDYLAAEGVAEEKFARVCAPAGLDLGASTPEEIALSIMSQIVAVRHGATAKPLNREETKLSGEAQDKVVSHCDTDRTEKKVDPKRPSQRYAVRESVFAAWQQFPREC